MRTQKLGKKRILDTAPNSGVLENGELADIGVTGGEQDSLKVYEENSHMMRELLIQQKITNQYLSIIAGLQFKEVNIEE